MAHTTTERAHGNATCKALRNSVPCSSRRLRYSISPARPDSTHSVKRAAFCAAAGLWGSWTSETPEASNPASRAHSSSQHRNSGVHFCDSIALTSLGGVAVTASSRINRLQSNEMPYPFLEDSTPANVNAAKRIDMVLFDYGMVLSGPPDPAAWAVMRTVTGLDEDHLHAGYWAFRHDYDRGALTGPAYWHAVAAHAGVTLDNAQVAALLAADIDLWTQLNTPMVEWARRLQRAGIRNG